MNILEKLKVLFAKVEEISLELEDLIDELEELEAFEIELDDEDELDEDELDEDEENILVVLSSKE
jgi:hypothetical protein